MAEPANIPAALRQQQKDKPKAEQLDPALIERIRSAMELVVEAGRRQMKGEVLPEGSSLMRELTRQKNAVGQEFLTAAERGNAARLQAFIDHSSLINHQDPKTGETALHIVAANGARKALRVLLATGKLAHLARDAQGRLPSELAYLHGEDPAMARLLAIKEKREAARQGSAVTRRPAPSR